MILSSQKESQYAKAKAFKQRLIEIDKKRGNNAYKLSDIDKENLVKNANLLSQAQKIMEQNEDCVKDMNHIVLYAKIASIRDRQLEEHKAMEKMFRNKEMKLDMMMELERLKELKFQEDREVKRKKQLREGSLVIIDQIKDREMERLKEKEQIRQEGVLMLKQIKEMEEEDRRILEKKKIQEERMAKEVEETNKILEQYDFIYLPAAPSVAPKIGEKSDRLSNEYLIADNHLVIGNFAGLPSISLPIGYEGHLPFDANISGRPFEEAKLLNIANFIEKDTHLKGK